MAATTYTKGQIVEMALGELGIASYVFDIEAEEDSAALRKLDAWMGAMQANLEDTGYEQPATSGASLPGDDPGIDEAIVLAVVSNLAVLIAPSYGKTPSPDTRTAAREGRALLYSLYGKVVTPEISSRVPMGAGNRRWRTYFPRADAEP